ncbi:cytochrome-c oxidase, cbb3-type subunit II [Paracoccus sp. SCSIO 75233]|uniref:cytochrome-c oxidase, cbb3-type subunit II n=1 Tax=Paracoccus sp. SCSIO 75233 TaxID=3017782 RepID=UPI0022F0E96E|nr:cytochrome-c oxidase, cbb3-type subunit II [Paracoccus sp. SCSIO 75233]WBU54000.1 cytochrome-c oxidase, cbb3-type subunit II [Paracoccus sp. SCSIO 75233]
MFDFQARTHYRTERHSMALALGIIAVASVGGMVEIAPLFTIDETVETAADMRLYTPLEQAGRDIYIREGCYACHSQMIRTLRDEVERYGPYSLAAESQYDHPMLWGSKRTGPDLARIGGKYSDDWQSRHLIDPRSVVPQSVMPSYAFLQREVLETASLPPRLAALRTVGVPYSEEQIANATTDALAQARPDGGAVDGVIDRYGEATNIRVFDGDPGRVTEMDALVAYLQILGRLTSLPYEIEQIVEN